MCVKQEKEAKVIVICVSLQTLSFRLAWSWWALGGCPAEVRFLGAHLKAGCEGCWGGSWNSTERLQQHGLELELVPGSTGEKWTQGEQGWWVALGGWLGSLSPSRWCSKVSKLCAWCGGWGKRGWGQERAAGHLWEVAEQETWTMCCACILLMAVTPPFFKHLILLRSLYVSLYLHWVHKLVFLE